MRRWVAEFISASSNTVCRRAYPVASLGNAGGAAVLSIRIEAG